MGKIMMCGSFKGGVGKTASSWNLAYCLAEMGKKVLAVDFDSQANLSTCFGIEDPAAVPLTIGHLMMDQLEDEELPEPAEFIQKRNSVDFIPSSNGAVCCGQQAADGDGAREDAGKYPGAA